MTSRSLRENDIEVAIRANDEANEAMRSLAAAFEGRWNEFTGAAQALNDALASHRSSLETATAALSETFTRQLDLSALSATSGSHLRSLEEEVRRSGEWIRRQLEQIRTLFPDDPGTFWGDFDLVVDDSKPEHERCAALERMADKWFRNPVHPRRWLVVKDELVRRAEEGGTTPYTELRKATMQVLPEALNSVPMETPVDHVLNVSRRLVANLVTEDLAGPDWRRRQSGRELSLDELDYDVSDENLSMEYRQELEELRRETWRIVEALPAAQRRAAIAVMEGRPRSNAERQALLRMRRSPQFRSLVEELAI